MRRRAAALGAVTLLATAGCGSSGGPPSAARKPVKRYLSALQHADWSTACAQLTPTAAGATCTATTARKARSLGARELATLAHDAQSDHLTWGKLTKELGVASLGGYTGWLVTKQHDGSWRISGDMAVSDALAQR